jgi:predicted alpha/beta hydrolase family esterase
MTNLLGNDVIHARPVMIVSLASDGPRHWSPPPTVNARPVTLDIDANPHRGLWALQLDDAIRAATEPTLLVGEGLACLAIARWAQLSPPRYVENIAGACLFAPLAFASHQAPLLRNLQPSPSVRLPFPSTVIDTRASLSIARVLELADIWGSDFADADAVPAAWRSGNSVPAELVAAAAMRGKRQRSTA